jgi:hypothetical protein
MSNFRTCCYSMTNSWTPVRSVASHSVSVVYIQRIVHPAGDSQKSSQVVGVNWAPTKRCPPIAFFRLILEELLAEFCLLHPKVKERIICLSSRYPKPIPQAECGAGSSKVSYLALHPMGFSVPRRLLGKRWAFTPPFHPYPTFRGRPGGLFSVALSVKML